MNENETTVSDLTPMSSNDVGFDDVRDNDDVEDDNVPMLPDDKMVSERHDVPVIRQLGVALGILLLVFGVTYVGTLATLMEPEEAQSSDVVVAKKLPPSEQMATSTFTDVFADTKIRGKAAYVWDVKNQRPLFNKNADDQLPIASITKLMTALVAYELLGPDAAVSVSIDAIRTDGDSGLRDGEEFTVQDLLDLTLIGSSNDGAAALSMAAVSSVIETQNPDQLFVDAMNIRASELGLEQTVFKNPTGLDENELEPGALSTARDVTLLMEYIITHYPEVTALTSVDATTVDNSEGAYHRVENTNEIVKEIDGIIASKTGYTTLAGGNLVVAFDAGFNRPIIVTVLGSTHQERFSDVRDLVKRARAYVVGSPE